MAWHGWDGHGNVRLEGPYPYSRKSASNTLEVCAHATLGTHRPIGRQARCISTPPGLSMTASFHRDSSGQLLSSPTPE
jgi:hypothetical protein